MDGRADGGLLQLPDADLDAAGAGLPLPLLAQQLEDAFAVLAQLHAFLTRTHIQVGRWRMLSAAGACGLPLGACRLRLGAAYLASIAAR